MDRADAGDLRGARPEVVETYRGSTSRGVRPETLAEYRADLALAVAYFGRTRLTAIGPSDVGEFAIRLAEEGRGARTVQRIVGTLRLVLASAVEDGLLKANPALGVRLGGIGAKPAQAGQSEEERARVLIPRRSGSSSLPRPRGSGASSSA